MEVAPNFAAPRRARPDESATIADLYLRSRYAAVPSIPAPVHTDDETREWFATVVLPEREVWVINHRDAPAALMVLEGGWIEQLYVDPALTGQGLGSVMVDVAKERFPGGLRLWTFQSNVGAHRFYERHGFHLAGSTDGDNEEGEPDFQYRWSAP